MEPKKQQERWRVGDLIINVPQRTVHRSQQLLHVTNLSFDLLLALIHAAPEPLDQDELIEKVWRGQVVSPETITQRVHLTREALGDDATHPRYIAIVRSHGYRLIESVEPIIDSLDAVNGSGKLRRLSAFAALAAILLFAAILLWSSYRERENTDSLENSLAVLPFYCPRN